jgi:hypothetical protein
LHVHRCYSSLVHPTDAADAPGGFHDRCDTFDETLVIATHAETSRVFGGFAGGSWAGTGWDSSADDSFIMELSPYPRRWESSGTSNFIMKDVYGWPEWGGDELRFGQRGPLGLGDTTNPNAYDARCIAGVVYGTQANQPCGANANAWGATQMEVYYQCGEGSGNGPCPWDPPPPPAVNISFGDNTVLIPEENTTTTTTTSFAGMAGLPQLRIALGADGFSSQFSHIRNGPGVNVVVPEGEGSHIMQWSAQTGFIKKTLSGSGTIEVMYGCPRSTADGGTAATYISLDGAIQHEATTYGPHVWSGNFTHGQELIVGERLGSGGLNLYYVTITSTPDMTVYDFDRQASWEVALESWGVSGNWTK